MYNENLARDMELFAPRTPYHRASTAPARPKSQPNPAEQHWRESDRQKRMAVVLEHEREERRAVRMNQARMALLVLICGTILSLLFSLIVSDAHLHSITQQTAEVEKQIKLIKQDNEAMRRDFEVSMSDAYVENYAVNILGLRKRESCQTEWITIDTGNVFVYAPKSDSDSWIADKVDAFMAYLD